jgi:hypothetical protein
MSNSGSKNPGFYTLMYGKVSPGYHPKAQERPSSILRGLTRAAAEQGRLVVDPEQAAAHVLVANIGVTLRQIILAEADPQLSDAVRDGVIAAITGTTANPANPIASVLELRHSTPGDTWRNRNPTADLLVGATQSQLLAACLRLFQEFISHGFQYVLVMGGS